MAWISWRRMARRLMVVGVLAGGSLVAANVAQGQDWSKDPALNQTMNQAYQKLMADPAMMEKAKKLQNDPNFQSLANDKGFAQAVKEGNMNVLKNHPAVRALMANPTAQELQRLAY